MNKIDDINKKLRTLLDIKKLINLIFHRPKQEVFDNL